MSTDSALNQQNLTHVHPRPRPSTKGISRRSQVQSSPFRVTFLSLTLHLGYQVILTRFPSLRDVALARQVTELTNQRVRFDVNPEPLNL